MAEDREVHLIFTTLFGTNVIITSGEQQAQFRSAWSKRMDNVPNQFRAGEEVFVNMAVASFRYVDPTGKIDSSGVNPWGGREPEGKKRGWPAGRKRK